MCFATAAYNFSTSELQKVFHDYSFFNILTSKCAFRHNFSRREQQKVLSDPQCFSVSTSEYAFRRSGVQFFICLRNSYLRARRFNRPTVRLTRHTNHGKNTAFRDFSSSFFLLTFALLHLLSFDLTACLICFSTLHIVGSLLFKLPPTTTTTTTTTTMTTATTTTTIPLRRRQR